MYIYYTKETQLIYKYMNYYYSLIIVDIAFSINQYLGS